MPDKEKTILNLLSIDNFQPHIIAVFIQNASKIFAKLAADPDYNNSSNKIYNLCSQIEEKIKPYLKNQNLEIQERATTLSEIIAIVKSMKNENISKQQVDKTNLLMNDSNEHSDAMTNGDDETNDGSNVSNVMINLQSFYYAYPLNPVAAKAQRKVPIPIGLDLDTPFDLPESEDESDDYGDDYEKVIHLVDDEQQNDIGESSDELNKRQEKNNNENELLRRFEQENNPNYLKTTKSSKPMAKKSKRKTKKQNDNFDENNENEDSDKNEIFSQELSSTKQNASIPGLISSEKYLLQMKKTDNVKKDDGKYKKKTTKKKNTKVNTNNEDNEDEEENDNKISIRALEMPEGVDLNDNDEDDDDSFKQASDPHKALAKVNLDDVINDLNKMRQKTAIDSKIPETKEKTGKKKKSGKKVVKTSVVNDLITGKKVVKVAKSEKAGKKNDDPIIKLKDNSPVKMKPKKSNKVKKIADSKNRDEYEETLDKI